MSLIKAEYLNLSFTETRIIKAGVTILDLWFQEEWKNKEDQNNLIFKKDFFDDFQQLYKSHHIYEKDSFQTVFAQIATDLEMPQQDVKKHFIRRINIIAALHSLR